MDGTAAIAASDSDPQGIYTMRLRREILRIVQGGPIKIEEIFSQAGGAFPTDVNDLLGGLVREGLVQKSRQGYASVSCATKRACDPSAFSASAGLARTGSAPGVSSQPGLTESHLGDYDWRFTEHTVHTLAARLSPHLSRGDRVALLGATSLFVFLGAKYGGVTLYDRSPVSVREAAALGPKGTTVHQDMFDPMDVGRGAFGVVVADPPWYFDFHRAFVLRAAELLQEGGLMLLSVLGWLTRPSALDDREDILGFATEAGFHLLEAVPALLRYETPPFEREVLSECGVACSNWRSGDLFVFRLVRSTSPRLTVSRPRDEPEWDDFTFGNMRIKLRRWSDPVDQPLKIEPAGDRGSVLRSVSRRSLARDRIDLWTSRNRAYRVTKRGAIREALDRLQTGVGAEDTCQGLSVRLSEVERHTLLSLLLDLEQQRDEAGHRSCEG